MLDMLEASLSHKQIVVWRGHIVPVCEAHMVSGEPGVKAHSSVIWDIKYETLIPMLRCTSVLRSGSHGQMGFSFEGVIAIWGDCPVPDAQAYSTFHLSIQ